ncbi:MalY/PatB family protein [Clostridium sp.]|uniref:MalY/PatB family protein n=1 Tax=Clostridium sp. TaxID=1506 RepID=UPI003463BA4F
MVDFDKVINRRNTMCAKWDTVSEDILPMWVADMDFESPKEVIEALRERVDHGVYGYLDSIDSYYEAVKNWMEKRHNYNVDKSWIVSTPSVVATINIAIRAFTKEGDKILIETPVYHPFFHAVKNNNRTLVESSLIFNEEKYVMDFQDLENKFKHGVKLMILCSPHNPVGRVWTKEELINLRDLCLKYKVLVISDEIHSDLTFKDNPHTVFASLGNGIEDISITCIAPSKTFNIAGIQASNVIIHNKALRDKFVSELDSVGFHSINIFAVAALTAAYNSSEYWLDELLVYIKDNYLYVKEYLEKHIPKVKVMPYESTYLLWLDFRELNLSQEELVKLLEEKAKIFLNDGTMFGKDGKGFMRMNIGCPRELLNEGLKRLKRGVDSLEI